MRGRPASRQTVSPIFLASDLDEVEDGPHPNDGEDLQRAWVPLPEVLQRVRSGDITNGLAVAGLLAARTRVAM